MSRLMVTAAAAGMALAPIAAQANTRAGDNAPVYTNNTVSQPGDNRAEAERGSFLRGTPGIIVILFGAAAAAGIIAIVESGNSQSPGT